LINQRQGGRRRGRGGQGGGGRNLGGQPGNRQDNRQRGNAAQLLEKYKSMARDAQLAGDRVQTEYYLQYADHYFRVLSESRARFEEQDRQRRPRDEEFDGDEDEGSEVEADGGDDERQERSDRNERYGRRDNRDGRDNRDRDGNRNRERRPYREERAANRSEDDDSGDRVNGADDDDSLPLDVLPPAIGADGPSSVAIDIEEEEPAPKPRRKPRAPRTAAGDDEIAPAA